MLARVRAAAARLLVLAAAARLLGRADEARQLVGLAVLARARLVAALPPSLGRQARPRRAITGVLVRPGYDGKGFPQTGVQLNRL